MTVFQTPSYKLLQQRGLEGKHDCPKRFAAQRKTEASVLFRTCILVVTCAAISSCGDAVEEDQPVEIVRQSLGPTWTGPWASNTQQNIDPIGAPATSGGKWLYGTVGGGLAWTTLYSDDETTWRVEGIAPYSRPSVAATSLVDGSGKVCNVVAYKSIYSQMQWITEVASATGCKVDQTVVHPATLDGGIGSGPAIASYGLTSPATQRYWAFALRTSDGALLYDDYAGTGTTRDHSGTWGNWRAKTDGALKPSSSPAAVSTQAREVYVFIRDLNDNLDFRVLTLSGTSDSTESWGSWQYLGIPQVGGGSFASIYVNSDPAVATRGPGKIDVCVLGTDNNVWCRSLNSGSWSAWSQKNIFATGLGAPALTTDGTDTWIFQRESMFSQVYARTL